MSRSTLAACTYAAILSCLASCASTPPTSLRIDTDPPGADVESPQIGYLGTTPLVWKFTQSDLKKVGGRGNVNMDIAITKRGFVTIKTLPLSFDLGTNHTVKKILGARLEEVAITSDPGAVAVFQIKFATKAARTAFYATTAGQAQIDWIKNNPTIVTQRFLGATPTSYQYDPDNQLEDNEPLLFTKTGFKDQVIYFKVSQERIHGIMQK